MTLADYMAKQDLTLAAFAEALEASGRVTVGIAAVSKWRRGASFPRPQHMREIERVTGGEVTAADFVATYVGREPVA